MSIITHSTMVYSYFGKMEKDEVQPWISRVHEMFHDATREHRPRTVWMACDDVLTSSRKGVRVMSASIGGEYKYRLGLETRVSTDQKALHAWLQQMADPTERVVCTKEDAPVLRSLLPSRKELVILQKKGMREFDMRRYALACDDSELLGHAQRIVRTGHPDSVGAVTERGMQRLMQLMLRDPKLEMTLDMRAAMLQRMEA